MASPVSKFGGVPVDTSQVSKFGGVPVDEDVRHGATGSWDGFGQGVKDAVKAPFDPKNWKSLTDNPMVKPFLNASQNNDILTPANRSNLDTAGKIPSPYQAGGMVANTVMAGTPEALKSGFEAVRPPVLNLEMGDTQTPGFASRVKTGVDAAAPDVSKGLGSMAVGGAAARFIPGPAIMKEAMGIPSAIYGGRQIISGLKTGLDAFRGPENGPVTMPEGYKAPITPPRYEAPYTPAEVPPREAPVVYPAARNFDPTEGRVPSSAPPAPTRSGPLLPPYEAPYVPVGVPPRPAPVQYPVQSFRPDIESRVIEQDTTPSIDMAPAPVATPDTPASARARANNSRAKFDANGQRNQLKPKQ